MNKPLIWTGATLASAAAFYAPNIAHGESFPLIMDQSIAEKMYGDPCGPVYIDGEAIDPKLVSAVVELGQMSLSESKKQIEYPPLDLHVHYLKGGAAHNVLDDSAFDRYIDSVGIKCEFDSGDALMTVVKYTDEERVAYNRRFGNLDLSTKDASPLKKIYNEHFFVDLQTSLSANLANKSTTEQSDLVEAVNEMSQAYTRALERSGNIPTIPNTQPSQHANQPSEVNKWVKENWPYLGEGFLGLSFAATAGFWLKRRREIKSDITECATAADRLLLDSYALLLGKTIGDFSQSFTETSYSHEQRLGSGPSYTADDGKQVYQDRKTTEDEVKNPSHVIPSGLTKYSDFEEKFEPSEELSAESSIKDLLGDPEIATLWELRHKVITSVRNMVTSYSQLHLLSKKFWPGGDDYTTARMEYNENVRFVKEMIDTYTEKYDDCKKAATESSARFEVLSNHLSVSMATLHKLERDGWDITALSKEHDNHNKKVDDLRQRSFKQPISASEEAVKYSADLLNFRKDCESYAGRYVENKRLQTVRVNTLQRLHNDTLKAASTLDTLSPTSPEGYHETCTEDIDAYDNDMSIALKELEEAQGALASKLDTKSTEIVQIVEQAAKDFDIKVAKVDDLVEQIAERRDFLEKLKTELPESVAELETSLNSHISDALRWGEDIDSNVLDGLNNHHAKIDHLRNDLAPSNQRPKYLAIQKSFEHASSSISDSYSVAVSQHNEANQLRSSLESTDQQIQAAVGRYNSFCSMNSQYINSSSKHYDGGISTDGTRSELRSKLSTRNSILGAIESDLNTAQNEVERKKAAERAEQERRRAEAAAAAAASEAARRNSSSGFGGGSGMSGNRGGV